MASPYKAKRETPFTKLGSVSGKSKRVGRKVMKDKKPGPVTPVSLCEEECEALLSRIKGKQ